MDALIKSPRRALEYVVVHTPRLRSLYWDVAPKYYARRLHPDILETQLSIDPFKIHYVDPSSLDRFTGVHGRPSERISDIGGVKNGNWDRKSRRDPESLVTSDKLTNTVLYESLRDHFCNDTPWEETELLTKAETADKPVWHNCKSRADILERCQTVDELYHSIRKDGYKTQFELLRERSGLKPVETAGFLNALLNEITVDIGRDGNLLLTDGRHRLAIAKILNLDDIPVVVLSRHREWIEKLQARNLPTIADDHPDVGRLSHG